MIWIDIDNPPQVQYLLPFKEALERQGIATVLTARDHSITFDILNRRNVSFVPCGTRFGKTKAQKVWGVLRRSVALTSRLAGHRPSFVISSSRSSALAARMMSIPSYIFCDYEFAELKSYRALGSHLVFPEVIGLDTFEKLGFAPNKLIPFPGIKEDLSFSNVDIENTPAHQFLSAAPNKLRILFRPPGVEGHYHQRESEDVAAQVLRCLAARPDIVTVLSPRYDWQSDLTCYEWINQPIVLGEGIEFVSLLKAVDAVITSGGTMAREAACLGIPSFSILRGQKCAVDRSLEALGALTFIEDPSDVLRLKFLKNGLVWRSPASPSVLQNLVNELLRRSPDVG